MSDGRQYSLSKYHSKACFSTLDACSSGLAIPGMKSLGDPALTLKTLAQNANPKPFIWTKDPNKIIAAVKRGHQV